MTNKDHGQGTNHLRARRAARALTVALLVATLLPAVETLARAIKLTNDSQH